FPLSVFTSPSLSLINANAPTMDTVKLNAAALGEKQIRVMSTATFEATVLREAEMDGAQWTEAAYNMISFTKKGSPSPAHTRCNAHFGFFATLQDAGKNFPAIRATDIALRKRYVSTPFAYSRDLYDRELYNEIMEWRIKEPRQTQLPNGGGRGATPARRARGGGGRGSAPFQKGNAGAASSTVCLVCAVRGHFYSDCNSHSFSDGTPLHCSIRDRDIRTSGSHETLCRAWNAKGAAAACLHDQTQRVHACSFCGNKNHHAFSWTCRANPSSN
ncbi:hypothetical protein R3P38DRAFT_2512412, partial [Favolaschia claudopus]